VVSLHADINLFSVESVELYVSNRSKDLEVERRFLIFQVVFGHSRHLWGLAVHPDDDMFATGGHDKNVAMWRRNKLLWSIQVRSEYQSVRVPPNYFVCV
jgi:microtubule-associated protein-like 1/2